MTTKAVDKKSKRYRISGKWELSLPRSNAVAHSSKDDADLEIRNVDSVSVTITGNVMEISIYGSGSIKIGDFEYKFDNKLYDSQMKPKEKEPPTIRIKAAQVKAIA